MPLVSIILRSKNEEKWLPYCLDMISKQTFKDYEIVLVDNDSKDRTLKIAKEFKIKKIINIKKFLPGKALNLGIAKSVGKYIVCLSSHCIPENKNWLENFMKNFKNKNNKLGAVYGRQLPLKFSSPNDKRDLLITFGLDRKVQKKDYFFHNANSIIPRAILRKFPFDEKVRNLEDRIWGKKIIESGLNIIYDPSAAVYHYHGIHHNNSSSRSEGVVKIINTTDTDVIEKIPEILKPENNINYAIVPIDNFKDNTLYKKNLTNKLLKDLLKSRYINKIFLISKNDIFFKDIKIKNITRKQARVTKNDSIDEIMLKSLKIIEKKNPYPNSIIFVNYDYVNRPSNIFDQMIKNYYYNNYDSLFYSLVDYGNYWFKDDNQEYKPTNDTLKIRNQKQPLYKALYGLGCITSPENILNNKLIGGKIGIIPTENILHSFRIKNLPKKTLKEIIKTTNF